MLTFSFRFACSCIMAVMCGIAFYAYGMFAEYLRPDAILVLLLLLPLFAMIIIRTITNYNIHADELAYAPILQCVAILAFLIMFDESPNYEFYKTMVMSFIFAGLAILMPLTLGSITESRAKKNET